MKSKYKNKVNNNGFKKYVVKKTQIYLILLMKNYFLKTKQQIFSLDLIIEIIDL